MNSANAWPSSIDAAERLVLVLARDAAEAGARRVDEHEVAGVEQAVVVVDELVGRGRRVRVVGGDDARGPNAPMCSHTVAEPGPPLNRNVIGRVPRRRPCLK